LDVHTVASALGRVVRAAVPDPVALGEGSVERDEVRIALPQDLERARCAVREQAVDRGDAGLGGAEGNAEAGRDLVEGVLPAQVRDREPTRLLRR
jgi:hypothetical protein